jgi:hypothetical protein
MGRLVVALVLMGAAAVGFAQEAKTTLALPPAPLLPAALGKTTRVAEGDSGDGLGSLDATDAVVLKEDGIRRFARSEYTEDGKPVPEARPRVDGKQHGTVTVYQFMDASGAVAAFDYFRSTGKAQRTNPRLGDASTFDKDGVIFRSGVNVVREDFNRGGETLMPDVIAHLPKVGGPAGITPSLPTYLPGKGLEAESVRYSLGAEGYKAMGGALPPEILGFDKAGEVVTAKYAGRGTLTLLMYPTPQIAGDHLRQIEAYMKTAGPTAGTVMLRREGPLVLLTTGVWTEADAHAMVENIHLRNEVTFDKKMPLEFHAEVQKTYSLLTSIAVFCGVGALAAVILGLFLGYGRAAIRVMQGKPAASEPEFLRIDLRGQAAPIHTDGPGQPG